MTNINKDEVHKKMEQAYEQIEKVHDQMYQTWLDGVLFTWEWWVSISLSIIPWLFWFLFRKKNSTYRLLTAGLWVAFISTVFDSLGVALGFWHYHFEVFPIIPSFSPWDITLMPIIVMFILQIRPNANPYIKSILFGVIGAFLAEPFFEWLGLYKRDQWEYIYSFPLYSGIYLMAHSLLSRNEFAKINE